MTRGGYFLLVLTTEVWLGGAHSGTQTKSAISSTSDGKGAHEITYWFLKLPHGRDMCVTISAHMSLATSDAKGVGN